MKGRNTREHRFDKRKDFSAAKENSKTKNAVLSKVVQQKRYMQIIRQNRKCHIFVRNIDKTLGFYVTTSIKGHNQREAIHLQKRFQWVNISVQSVNDSLQDQTV